MTQFQKNYQKKFNEASSRSKVSIIRDILTGVFIPLWVAETFLRFIAYHLKGVKTNKTPTWQTQAYFPRRNNKTEFEKAFIFMAVVTQCSQAFEVQWSISIFLHDRKIVCWLIGGQVLAFNFQVVAHENQKAIEDY